MKKTGNKQGRSTNYTKKHPSAEKHAQADPKAHTAENSPQSDGMADQLHKSEAMARELLNIPHAVTILISPDGIVLDVNETVVRRFGRSRLDIVGKSAWDLIPADVASRRRAYLDRVLTTKKAVRFEDERAGVWNDHIFSPIFDEAGNISKVAIVAIDITERKRIQMALEESEERFRAFMDNSPSIAWMKDEEGRYAYISKTFEKRFDIRFEGVRGKTDSEIWPLEIADQFRKNDLKVLHGGQPIEVVEEATERNGERSFWWIVKFPFQDTSGQRYVGGIGVDITEQRQFEEERIEQKSLQRAMDKVLMDIHDGIGGITTNISLLSEVARKASSLEDIEKALKTISDLAREGMGEIRNLMYSLDREDLNWHSFAIELRSQGMKFLEPHAIAFTITSDVRDNVTNPGSHLCLNLLRIYQEALMNTIKHAKATNVAVTLQIDNDNLVLTIQDDGRGFKQSALMGKGRGVGNIMTRIAQMHGTVTVTVTVTGDGGTCVSIKLPLSVKPAADRYARLVDPIPKERSM
ncbi:MAG TPA: PAS domain-containing protein [Nitrospirota bacterium]|nr:PAS domain-containing protein [Nitrospirota bacterium]